jgi:hypothetical protein
VRGEFEMAAKMFAAIRRAKMKPGMSSEFARRVEAGAVPIMKKMVGFKAFYMVYGPDDTVISITLLTNKAAAEGATEKLMPWIKENLGPLLTSPPEPTDGEIAVSVVD